MTRKRKKGFNLSFACPLGSGVALRIVDDRCSVVGCTHIEACTVESAKKVCPLCGQRVKLDASARFGRHTVFVFQRELCGMVGRCTLDEYLATLRLEAGACGKAVATLFVSEITRAEIPERYPNE